MALGIIWPANIGVLRLTHNAHAAFNQSVEEYFREQCPYEINKNVMGAFISIAERDRSFEKNELWEIEYQAERWTKPGEIWASSFDALIDYINDPENTNG